MEPHSPAERLNVVLGARTQGLPEDLNRLLSNSLTTSFNLITRDTLDGLVEGCSGPHPQVALLAFPRARDNEAAIQRLTPLDPRLATIAVVDNGDVEATLRAIRAGATSVVERKALQTAQVVEVIRDARYPRELSPAASSSGAAVTLAAECGSLTGRVRDITDQRLVMVTDDSHALELTTGERIAIRLRCAVNEVRAGTDGVVESITHENLGFAIELNIAESRTTDLLALQRIANGERRKSPRVPINDNSLGMVIEQYVPERLKGNQRTVVDSRPATLKDVSNEGLSFVVRQRIAEDLRHTQEIRVEISDPGGQGVIELVGVVRRRSRDERGTRFGLEVVEVEDLPLAAQRACLQRLVRFGMSALIREGR